MFPEREAKSKYLATGANPVHIQMAANPQFYKPYPVPREYPVTFVGQRYLNRWEYVHYLFAKGIDVRVWGPGWQAKIDASYYKRIRRMLGKLKRKLLQQKPLNDENQIPAERCGPPLSDEELIKMYSRSIISLGFSEVQIA